MGKRLVSRAELARIAGVSRAAITKACKGQLRPACEGKAIDLDHEAVELYLAGRGVKVPKGGRSDGAPTSGDDSKRKPGPRPTAARPRGKKTAKPAPAPRPRRAVREVPPPPPPELDEEDDELEEDVDDELDDIEGYTQLTLDQIVRRFGTRAKFRIWLDARKKIADIREKELKNDETTGCLIERELVKTHVFGALEEGNRRLLGDTPKTIARELYALAATGAPVEEAEARVRKIISSQLKPVKTKAARVLRNA